MEKSAPGSPGLLVRLFRCYLSGEWSRVLLGFFLLLAASATAVLHPWPVKMILDNVVGSDPPHPWLAAAAAAVGDWVGRPQEPKILLLPLL